MPNMKLYFNRNSIINPADSRMKTCAEYHFRLLTIFILYCSIRTRLMKLIFATHFIKFFSLNNYAIE